MATIEQRVTSLEAFREGQELRNIQMMTEIRDRFDKSERTNARLFEAVNANIADLRTEMVTIGKEIRQDMVSKEDFAPVLDLVTKIAGKLGVD